MTDQQRPAQAPEFSHRRENLFSEALIDPGFGEGWAFVFHRGAIGPSDN